MRLAQPTQPARPGLRPIAPPPTVADVDQLPVAALKLISGEPIDADQKARGEIVHGGGESTVMRGQNANPRAIEAVSYARRGWWVLPLHGVSDARCACGDRQCVAPGRHPMLANGVRGARDPSIVRDWWERWPGAGIGVATGAVCGLIVLKVDQLSAGAAELAIWGYEEGWETKAAVLGNTTYYLCECDGPVPSKVNVLPGVDVLGDGGFVIVPPNEDVNGDACEWDRATDNGWASLNVAPDWLLELIERSGK